MKFNAHKAHQRLWNWLAGDSTRYKEDWPEWEWNGGNMPRINKDLCFPCYVSGLGCLKCPIGDCMPFYGDWATSHNEVRNAKKLANLPWNGPQMIDL